MSGPLAAAQHIFDHDLTAERWRQLKKWGRQSHPDGTGGVRAHHLADLARRNRAEAFEEGRETWQHALAVEFWETLAETERSRLRAKLVSLATVAVAWVEDVDGRAGDRAAVVEPDVSIKPGTSGVDPDGEPYDTLPMFVLKRPGRDNVVGPFIPTGDDARDLERGREWAARIAARQSTDAVREDLQRWMVSA